MKLKKGLLLFVILSALTLCSCGGSTNDDMTNDSASVMPETTTTLE